jgi:hypothetical protein
MHSLTGDVKEASTFTIQWKRGPSKEETKPFTLDPAQGTIDINQTFVRYSQIYKDAKTGKYLKKMVSAKRHSGLIGDCSASLNFASGSTTREDRSLRLK